MKNVLKIIMIAALCLVVTGFVLLGIGLTTGGGRQVIQMLRNGELSWGGNIVNLDVPRVALEEQYSLDDDAYEWKDDLDDLDDLHENDIEWRTDHDDNSSQHGSSTSATESTVFEGTIDSQQFLADDIRKLQISLGGGSVFIEESEDNYCYLSGNNVGQLQVSLKNGKLNLKSLKNMQLEGMEIYLYIPTGMEFDEVDIEVGAGMLTAGSMVSREMDLEVGAGAIEIADCEVYSEFDATVGAGYIKTAGIFHKDISLEAAMGSITLKITGATDTDYDYEIECAAGNVTIGTNDYTGIAYEKEIRNNAGREISVDCSLGNVDIQFE